MREVKKIIPDNRALPYLRGCNPFQFADRVTKLLGDCLDQINEFFKVLSTVKDGADGADGKDGADGNTPYIKNGYWWIGNTNTNVPVRGEKGDKGDAFLYSDFTQEQLNALKGPKGDTGKQGIPGEKGDKGDQGEAGPKGDTGAKGDKGDKGDKGSKGDKGDAFTYNDFTSAQLAALKGEKGDKGDKGDTGEKGETGATGATGPQGPQGIQGEQGPQGEAGASDSVVIEAPVNATDATLPITTLTCEVGKYYRIDVPVETLDITLPAVSGSNVQTIVIYLPCGTTPAVTINSTAPSGGSAPDIIYEEGMQIISDTIYNIKCLWNGETWVVTYRLITQMYRPIEYLQGVDSQTYINTGINCIGNVVGVEVKFKATDSSSNKWFIGTYNGNNNDNYLFGINNSKWCFGSFNSAYNYSSLPIDNEDHIIKLNINGSTQLDNDVILNNSVYKDTSSGNTDIWLFRTHKGMAGFELHVRIYYCKIYVDGILRRDYIPVRIGTTGYMYDKVSNQLFGNAGTGNFILGPDV